VAEREWIQHNRFSSFDSVSQTGHPLKYKFISRYGSDHGGTFATIAASGKRNVSIEPNMSKYIANRRMSAREINSHFYIGGFIKVFSPLAWRDRYSSWDECNRHAAKLLEDVIINEDPETSKK
jgi:adenosylmethionine-8-amino-7-oxononanoate aminotransferase